MIDDEKEVVDTEGNDVAQETPVADVNGEAPTEEATTAEETKAEAE